MTQVILDMLERRPALVGPVEEPGGCPDAHLSTRVRGPLHASQGSCRQQLHADPG